MVYKSGKIFFQISWSQLKKGHCILSIHADSYLDALNTTNVSSLKERRTLSFAVNNIFRR